MSAAHDSPTIPDVFAMRKELRASREWQVVRRITLLGRSIHLLEGNTEELRRAVRYLTQDGRSYLLDQQDIDKWLGEMGRLLHNVVAAANTVVDHTRNLNKHLYGKSGIYAALEEIGKRGCGSIEYFQRREALKREPVVAFVHRLRNIFLHSNLPSIAYSEHFQRGARTRSVALARKDLLTSGGWNAAARKFLNNSPEDVDIGGVVEQYMTAVRGFYAWFAEHLEQVHAADYASVNAKLATIARANASSVFAALRSDAASVEAGTTSAHDALARWMSDQDKLHLELLFTVSPSSWVESALHCLGTWYGEIPQDIVTRYRNVSLR